MKQAVPTKIILHTSLLIFFFFLFVSAAKAHDYWFEADNFFPAENAPVAVHLQLGTRLVIEEERFYQPERTVYFKFLSAKNSVDLRGNSQKGAIPVAKFNVGQSGTYLLGMERNPVENILDAEKFAEYLREENLYDVIAEREKRGENEKFGYERYSRYIKSLIQVGDKKDDTYKRLLGFKLEIQPLENPYLRKVGSSLKLKVLFDGKPLKNTAVFSYNRSEGKVFVERYKTNTDGAFRAKLDRKGFWLIRLVKMERCRQNCGETDWESRWGALSFEMR